MSDRRKNILFLFKNEINKLVKINSCLTHLDTWERGPEQQFMSLHCKWRRQGADRHVAAVGLKAQQRMWSVWVRKLPGYRKGEHKKIIQDQKKHLEFQQEPLPEPILAHTQLSRLVWGPFSTPPTKRWEPCPHTWPNHQHHLLTSVPLFSIQQTSCITVTLFLIVAFISPSAERRPLLGGYEIEQLAHTPPSPLGPDGQGIVRVCLHACKCFSHGVDCKSVRRRCWGARRVFLTNTPLRFERRQTGQPLSWDHQQKVSTNLK